MAVNDHYQMSCIKRTVRAERRQKRDSRGRVKTLKTVGVGGGAGFFCKGQMGIDEKCCLPPLKKLRLSSG